MSTSEVFLKAYKDAHLIHFKENLDSAPDEKEVQMGGYVYMFSWFILLFGRN